MTAQMSDRVHFEECHYYIAGISGVGLFQPAMHGLFPAPVLTSCWRGYVCAYAVHQNHLLLRELMLFQDPEKHPQVVIYCGIAPVTNQFDAAVYRPLNVPVGFTGGLLLGAGFIQELYVHSGFPPAWKFQLVRELIFDKGELRTVYDRSAQAAEFRKTITPQQLEPGYDEVSSDEMRVWLDQTYTLQYERT